MSDGVLWAKQEQAYGCGVAALAMLTGQTYRQVAEDFARPLENGSVHDFAKRGLSLQTVDRYLAERGYAVCRLFLRDLFGLRTEWPPQPFADVHLCEVKVLQEARNNHLVIMRRDGSVLDPIGPGRRHLKYYYQVFSVAAVVRLRRPEPTPCREPPKTDRQTHPESFERRWYRRL